MNRLILDWPKNLWHKAGLDGNYGTIYVRGHAFWEEDFFEGDGLAAFIVRSCRGLSLEEGIVRLTKIIPALNGCWAIVTEWADGRIIAACDRVRSIPLFYCQQLNGILVSASIYPIVNETLPNISTQAAMDYLLCGYTTGSSTLYEGVHQVQAGEIIEYHPSDGGSGFNTTRYYRFLPESSCSLSEDELELRLVQVLDGVFSRWAKALAGRPILVPLSGGYDSRLIVGMLKRHGVEDVLCYTYGLSGSREVSISRKVASALGYSWEFVDYYPNLWHNYISDQRMQDYWQYASQAAALPHFQDFPAFDFLIRSRGLDRCVVMPGHGGEVCAGGHIPTKFYDNNSFAELQSIAGAILEYHFMLWPTYKARNWSKIRQEIEHRLMTQVSVKGLSRDITAAAICEMWDLENRQAKFINNSVRVYEFFNQDWAMPLWDYSLMDFFSTVPEKFRWQKRLYLNTMANRIYTGPLQRLREIPRKGGGLLTDRLTDNKPFGASRRRNIRRFLRQMLCVCGLFDIAQRWRYRYCGNDVNGFDYWFTEGLSPFRVTVGKVLRKYYVREHLPPLLWKLIERMSSRHVIDVICNGVLSAITLAKIYERQPKKTSEDTEVDEV